MKVWIEQSKCTGSGLCEMTVPALFVLGDDGLGYVKDNDVALSEPGGSACKAPVPKDLEFDVVDAAGACPGGCIHTDPE